MVMNTRDYARIAHAIRMAHQEVGSGMAAWESHDGIDVATRHLADMLASDTVANKGFDREAFLTSCGHISVVDDDDMPEYEHTHVHRDDGSPAMFLEWGAGGHHIMIMMNECGDTWPAPVGTWEPIK